MAILFPYKTLTPEQEQAIDELLGQFEGEISQCSFHQTSVQVVLNDHQITAERGQSFLDTLIGILQSDRWGTDLPTRFPERERPPPAYANRYSFSIPYDPGL
jgi:hypothetical protein